MSDFDQISDQAPVFWRRLDLPGCETARIVKLQETYRLEGAAVFFETAPCRLSYTVICDFAWRTRSAWVDGWVGETPIGLEIQVDAAQKWWMNGVEWPVVAGCVDLDLNFSPSTNLLAIRRSALAEGQAAEVRAAWLHFPSFSLEPLAQVYQRTGSNTYHYESSGGSFSTELTTNPAGFVIDYPPFWSQG